VTSRDDTAGRLAALEQILGHTASGTAPISATDADTVDAHLGRVSAERIRRLTAAFQGDSSQPLDAIDAIVIRLLLDEYSKAVSHLRAVARLAAATIDGAAEPVREARRSVHHLTKVLASAHTGPAPDHRQR
jgi:hypothetical protein